MTGATIGSEDRADGEPDAVSRGWVEYHDQPRFDALFVLTDDSLGIGRLDDPGQPWWVDLGRVTAADAVGDVVDGAMVVELFLDDGSRVRASWSESFTAPVVDVLQRLAGRPAGPVEASAVEAPQDATTPVTGQGAVAAAPPPPPVEAVAAPVPVIPAVPPAAPAPAAEGGASSGAALVLEDVSYLRGYPGQNKKRKKCVATLTRNGIEVTGPHDLSFRVAWDAVRTVEAQNADEARFRMNTKIHRDATALVVECQQDVTIVLEARDCPTIPLRSAINSLVADLRVVVV